MSCVMRKPPFCICKNKGTDQLRGQHLCSHYIRSTFPLLPKSEISVAVQHGLCQTWLETLRTGFLVCQYL